MKIRLIRTLILIVGIGILSSPAIGKNKKEVYSNEQHSEEIEQLNAKIDSLIKITSKITEERNYFSTALSSQTTIFSVIVTIVISLLSLASYLNIRGMMLKQKKEMLAEMNNHKSKIEEIESSTAENQKLVYKALGNLNVVISKVIDKNDTKIIYLIQAAKYNILYGSEPIALRNLNNAKRIIDTEGITRDFKKYDKVIQELQILIRSKNEKVMYISSHIVCKILEYKASNT